jgi:ComF family protein
MNYRPILLKLYSWISIGLDWIFPPECVGCGLENEHICPSCLENINYIGAQICKICGAPLKYGDQCNNCQKNQPYFNQLRSVATYEGPTREAIRHLKYKSGITLGEPLAKLMYDKVQDQKWNIDLVVPVPLSQKRRSARGYNQAAILAFPLSLFLNIKYSSVAVFRIKDTKSQVGLNAEARQENVLNAFRADRNKVKGKRILLVDDVTTTGATINACAKALSQADADVIYAITLAKAVHSKSDLDIDI